MIISVIYAYEANSQILIATVDSADALAYGNARKLVVSRTGFVSLVFHDKEEIFYTESSDDGLSWALPANISLNAGYSKFPALVIDSLGRKHVVWQDNTVPYNPARSDDKIRIYYKNFKDTSEISRRHAIPIGESVGNSLNPSLAVDEAGKLYAAWAAFMGLNLGWEINFSEGALIDSGLIGAYDWTYPEIPGLPFGISSSFFPSIDTYGGHLQPQEYQI